MANLFEKEGNTSLKSTTNSFVSGNNIMLCELTFGSTLKIEGVNLIPKNPTKSHLYCNWMMSSTFSAANEPKKMLLFTDIRPQRHFVASSKAPLNNLFVSIEQLYTFSLELIALKKVRKKEYK